MRESLVLCGIVHPVGIYISFTTQYKYQQHYFESYDHSKCLGIIFDCHLAWKDHVAKVSKDVVLSVSSEL